MEKKIRTFVFGTLIVMLLAACQAAGTPSLTGAQSGQTGFTGNGTGTRQSGQNGQSGTFGQSGQFGGFRRTQTPTVDPSPIATDTPVPTATPVNVADIATKTAQSYFNAVQSGDFVGASKLVSAFSLRVASMTAGDVQSALAQQQQNGVQWSNFQIKDSQVFDPQTVLVHVTYQVTSKDAKTGKQVQTTVDELWPIRLEVGNWLYNWGNVIDFQTLTVNAQTTAGLTLLPTQITRYTDRMVLTVLAQNSTNDPIVIGNQNQVLATFHFGDKTVDAVNTRYIFDALRGYPDVQITIKGLYTSYPDSVDIVKYVNLKVNPWFTFSLK